MAKLLRRSISKRTVEALSPEKDTVYWDSELPGFGVRVYPSGNKVYVAQTRARGKSTRVTIGRHGVITAEQARQRAASVIARVKAGEDPVAALAARQPAAGPTVAELAGRYLEEHVKVHCRPATEAQWRVVLARHILPALGALPLAAVTREQVAELHDALRETPAMSGINQHWMRVRKEANLEDVRLHDLRHSWASRALALGESLPMIGRLLGHTQVQTTARYAHLARDSVHEEAARIAASIGADLLGGGGTGADRHGRCTELRES